jgi:hypothetical protein
MVDGGGLGVKGPCVYTLTCVAIDVPATARQAGSGAPRGRTPLKRPPSSPGLYPRLPAQPRPQSVPAPASMDQRVKVLLAAAGGAAAVGLLVLAWRAAAATPKGRPPSPPPNPEAAAPAAPPPKTAGPRHVSSTEAKRIISAILDEFLLSAESGETARQLRTLVVDGAPGAGGPSASRRFIAMEVAKRAVYLIADRSDADGEKLAALLVQLVAHGVTPRSGLEAGLAVVAGRLHDMALDNPRAPSHVADLFVWLTQSDSISDDVLSPEGAAAAGAAAAAAEDGGGDAAAAAVAGGFSYLRAAVDGALRDARRTPLAQLRMAYSAALRHYILSGGAGLDVFLRTLASSASRHSLYELVRKLAVAAVSGEVPGGAGDDGDGGGAAAALSPAPPVKRLGTVGEDDGLGFGSPPSPASVRELCSDLLSSLVDIGLVTPFVATSGVLAAGVGDQALDDPCAPGALGTFIARAVADAALPPAFITAPLGAPTSDAPVLDGVSGVGAVGVVLVTSGPRAAGAGARAALTAARALVAPADISDAGVVTDDVHHRLSKCYGWVGRPLALLRQAATDAGLDYIGDVSAADGGGAGAALPALALPPAGDGGASPAAALAARVASGGRGGVLSRAIDPAVSSLLKFRKTGAAAAGAAAAAAPTAAVAAGRPAAPGAAAAAATPGSAAGAGGYDPDAEFVRRLAVLAAGGLPVGPTPPGAPFDALHNEAVRSVVMAGVGAPPGAAARVSSLLSSARHSGALTERALRTGLARAVEQLYFESSAEAQRGALPNLVALLLFLTRTGTLSKSPPFFNSLPRHLVDAAMEDDAEAAAAVEAAAAAGGSARKPRAGSVVDPAGSFLTLLRTRFEAAQHAASVRSGSVAGPVGGAA